jgi:hypothetical protein
MVRCLVTRVTRWVCLLPKMYLVQHIFGNMNTYETFSELFSCPKLHMYVLLDEIFKTIPKENNQPICENSPNLVTLLATLKL